jgi:hypothetical protein
MGHQKGQIVANWVDQEKTGANMTQQDPTGENKHFKYKRNHLENRPLLESHMVVAQLHSLNKHDMISSIFCHTLPTQNHPALQSVTQPHQIFLSHHTQKFNPTQTLLSTSDLHYPLQTSPSLTILTS